MTKERNRQPLPSEVHITSESLLKMLQKHESRVEQVSGDFLMVSREVRGIVGRKLVEHGLNVPEVDPDFFGRWGWGEYYGATTSTVGAIHLDGREHVLKVLREPPYRLDSTPEALGGVFSEEAGHFLFAWNGVDGDREVGLSLQFLSLLGELEAGLLFNPEHSPYKGLVGVRSINSQEIEVTDVSEIGVEAGIWPGLLMESISTRFNVAQVLLDWQAGELPGLQQEHVVLLLTQAAQVFYERSIPAGERLVNRFGSPEFFRRCLVGETPYDAGRMDAWEGADPVMIQAAHYARQIADIIWQFTQQHEDYLRSGPNIVIGHADPKPSNILIQVESAPALVELLRNGDTIPFALLDAQSLALNPQMLRKFAGEVNGERIWESKPGVNYAHWRVVPDVQQLAYYLMHLEASGLQGIHAAVLEELGVDLSQPLDKAWYLLQMAYKMGMVESLVQAPNWLSVVNGHGKTANPLLHATMNVYPGEAHRLALEAAQLAGLWGY